MFQLGPMADNTLTGEDVRVFEGTGTNFLYCPGLKEVTQVRCGSVDLFPTCMREFVSREDPNSAKETVRVVEFPMLHVTQDTNSGLSVLLRANYSNDGIWQKGEVIRVKGVWEDSPADIAPAQVSTAKGK